MGGKPPILERLSSFWNNPKRAFLLLQQGINDLRGKYFPTITRDDACHIDNG